MGVAAMKTSHVLLMLACCLIPIVALGAIFLFNVPVNTVILAGVALFCPISHLLMMKFMPGEHGSHSHEARPASSGHPERRRT